METRNKISYRALALFALACSALSSQARAACQQGCSDIASENTFLGEDALIDNTRGRQNTAVGFAALENNTDGFSNTATGVSALSNNTTGNFNTAIGLATLSTNTTGSQNTAVGWQALGLNTTGFNNTAIGGALGLNTTGSNNTATGGGALGNNKIGSLNTANGVSALISNTTGFNNTAIGFAALSNNLTGSNNIAVGEAAGTNLSTGSDNIDIGNAGVAGESGIIRIGTGGTHTAAFIAGIREAPLAQGAAVGVGITADGQLGIRASSARFKEAIKPMNKASEVILSLRPVTFRYKKELDSKATPQFGLIAEEVAKVDPDLVAQDAVGKPFTVRYDEINAMLLNEFLKDHRKVEEQANEIADLRAELKQQEARLQAEMRAMTVRINAKGL